MLKFSSHDVMILTIMQVVKMSLLYIQHGGIPESRLASTIMLFQEGLFIILS
jgi:hypothetical protein